HHQARAHLEIVRVLVATGEGVDVDELSLDRFGQGLEIGGSGDDPDLSRGLCSSGPEAAGEQHHAQQCARQQRHGVVLSSLEGMGRMGTENERGLEEPLVHVLGASAVVLKAQIAAALRALSVLVADAEAQELRWHEAQIRLHRPLCPRIDRKLRPVVAEPEGPAAESAEAERLQLAVHVPAVPLAGPLLLDRVLGGRVGDQDLADAVEVLAAHREERVLPALGPVLVLGVETDDLAVQLIRRQAVGDRGADLECPPLVEVEERADAPGYQRGLEAAYDEGDSVVTLEYPALQRDIKRY